jgi:hypothetical protein
MVTHCAAGPSPCPATSPRYSAPGNMMKAINRVPIAVRTVKPSSKRCPASTDCVSAVSRAKAISSRIATGLHPPSTVLERHPLATAQPHCFSSTAPHQNCSPPSPEVSGEGLGVRAISKPHRDTHSTIRNTSPAPTTPINAQALSIRQRCVCTVNGMTRCVHNNAASVSQNGTTSG